MNVKKRFMEILNESAIVGTQQIAEEKLRKMSVGWDTVKTENGKVLFINSAGKQVAVYDLDTKSLKVS